MLFGFENTFDLEHFPAVEIPDGGLQHLRINSAHASEHILYLFNKF